MKILWDGNTVFLWDGNTVFLQLRVLRDLALARADVILYHFSQRKSLILSSHESVLQLLLAGTSDVALELHLILIS